jgi:hypothetical protein
VDFGGNYACFLFEDTTQDWYFEGGGSLTQTQPFPSAALVPTTMEYVAEKNTGLINAGYGATTMTGGAYDLNGNFHADPGIGNDPYVFFQQSDSNGPVTQAVWANGTINSPADPMYFFYEAQ